MDTAVTSWLVAQAKEFYHNSKHKSPSSHDNEICIRCGGRDYVEKLWNSSTVKPEVFFLEFKIKPPKYATYKLLF